MQKFFFNSSKLHFMVLKLWLETFLTITISLRGWTWWNCFFFYRNRGDITIEILPCRSLCSPWWWRRLFLQLGLEANIEDHFKQPQLLSLCMTFGEGTVAWVSRIVRKLNLKLWCTAVTFRILWLFYVHDLKKNFHLTSLWSNFCVLSFYD